jgi:hypothetical protein
VNVIIVANGGSFDEELAIAIVRQQDFGHASPSLYVGQQQRRVLAQHAHRQHDAINIAMAMQINANHNCSGKNPTDLPYATSSAEALAADGWRV